MDLKELQGVSNDRFNETHEFHPKHPTTGAELGFTITIRSMRSDEMLRLMNRLSREAQLKATKEQRTGKAEVETMEQAIARDIETACVLTISFDGLKDDGKEVGSDADAIKSVLSQYTWLRKQIMDEAAEEQNFFKA